MRMKLRMKLSYTTEEVERWRDKVHRRLPRLAITSKKNAVRFIDTVGFCFAFKAENSELPCLWHAACGARDPSMPKHTHRDPFLGFVWEMKRVLPVEGKVFYGRVFKRRPTMISMDYFPYFYALSLRTGLREDYLNEYRRGRLSGTGKAIMEALAESSPQITRGLKLAVGSNSRGSQREFEKAMVELQMKFYIVKVAEYYDPFTFEWNTVDKAFSRLVKKAQKIHADVARKVILKKYFENQLVSSVQSIHSLFGWKKQVIYETLGQLVRDGVITGSIRVDGKDSRYYCLIS